MAVTRKERVTVKQAARAWLELDAVLVPDADDLPPEAIYEALRVLGEFIAQHEGRL